MHYFKSLETDTQKLVRIASMEAHRGHVFHLLVERHPLSEILHAVVAGVEEILPDSVCSVLMVSDDGAHLTLGAAPSAPEDYNRAVEGVPIRFGAGSCGTAAATGKRVVVSDIANDKLWADYRGAATNAGFASCWSEPVMDAEGIVLGTFAIYKHEVSAPDDVALEVIKHASTLTGIAIERDRDINELKRYRNHLEALVEERTKTVLKLNKDLRESTRAAVAADKAKGRFLAAMSHEIRTPLNGIVPVAELLLETELSPAQRDMINTIQSSGKALLDVVNEILDWSKIEDGKIELVKAPFNLSEVLKEVADILGTAARQKGLSLIADCHSCLNTNLMGDAVRIRQVLLNLVGNALKFTKEGEVRIRCQPLSQTPGSLQFMIEVIDTGIGIKPEDYGRIFNHYEQAEGGKAKDVTGTGLGLPISKSLIELMGGSIEVQSRYGKGSTFRILLDLEKNTVVPFPGTAAKPREIEHAQKSLHVLLADDNPVNVAIIETMLKRLGHSVRTATNGREALDIAASDDIDLALLDVQMPEMDGMEAATRIRDLPGDKSKIRILAVTAGLMPKQVKECKDAGMDDVLAKPVSLTSLNKILAEFEARRAGPA